jgi:hypothetical protein
MPKKYRVELSLVDDASGTQVDDATLSVEFDTDSEAKDDFKEKVKGAREKGKRPDHE